MCSVRIMLCDCLSCGLSDFTFISKIPLQIRFVCRCTHLLKEDLASLVQLVSHSAASNYDIALLVNCRSQPTHKLLTRRGYSSVSRALTGEQEEKGPNQC